jgi:hypothetical protein
MTGAKKLKKDLAVFLNANMNKITLPQIADYCSYQYQIESTDMK